MVLFLVCDTGDDFVPVPKNQQVSHSREDAHAQLWQERPQFFTGLWWRDFVGIAVPADGSVEL